MKDLLMRVDAVARPQGRVFYGWWIVAAAAGIQFLSGVLWTQSYGAYVVVLEHHFGWSKTMLAGAFAVTRVESGLLAPFQGWLADRFGPRVVLQVGSLLFGIGFILFSRMNSLVTFYLTFALIALGASLGGFPILMVSLVNFFKRHRAKAVAMSQMGFALGGISVPVVILMLESLGWRTTALVSGILIIAVALPLARVVRHRPDEVGTLPDGGVPVPEDRSRHAGPVRRDFTAREAMTTAAFWLIAGGHALALLTVASVMVHLVSHLTEGLGFSFQAAGFVVAMMTGFQMLGQLSGGYLGDLLNKRFICAACMLAHAAGMLLVTFATAWWMVAGFAVLHGFAWGCRAPLMVALRADYFGTTSFGTILGFSTLVAMLGMSGGPLLVGYLADVSGNYQSGFTLLAGLAVLGSLFFVAATQPAPRHHAA